MGGRGGRGGREEEKEKEKEEVVGTDVKSRLNQVYINCEYNF